MNIMDNGWENPDVSNINIIMDTVTSLSSEKLPFIVINLVMTNELYSNIH